MFEMYNFLEYLETITNTFYARTRVNTRVTTASFIIVVL